MGWAAVLAKDFNWVFVHVPPNYLMSVSVIGAQSHGAQLQVCNYNFL